MKKTKLQLWFVKNKLSLIALAGVFLLGGLSVAYAYTTSNNGVNVEAGGVANINTINQTGDALDTPSFGLTVPTAPSSDFTNLRLTEGPLQFCDSTTSELCHASKEETKLWDKTTSTLYFQNLRTATSTAWLQIDTGFGDSITSSTIRFNCGTSTRQFANIETDDGFQSLINTAVVATGTSRLIDSRASTQGGTGLVAADVAPNGYVVCKVGHESAKNQDYCNVKGQCENATSTNNPWHARVTNYWGWTVSSTQPF